MATEMFRPDVTDFLDNMLRSQLKQRLEEVVIPEKINGHKIQELHTEDLQETLVLAVRRDEDWTYNPKKSYRLVYV